MVLFSRVAVLLLASSLIHAEVKVLTSNYGIERTNASLQETVLTPASVNPDRFGKLGSFAVDGDMYAQPLYVPGVVIGGVARNVVFAVTMHNSVYAIDADVPASNTPLWKVNLGAAVPSEVNDSEDTEPETGILSTPVIDVERNTVYVVAATMVKDAMGYYLHALDLSTGAEKPGSPAEIKAVMDGGGDTSEGGKITFDPLMHLQRPGLLLANDNIYIAFGSHADTWPYHGWIFAYSAANVQQQVAVFNTTPQGDYGAVWQSGRGLAADADGNIYVASGNGDYDGVQNFGESLLKLSPALKLLDWYTPPNWEYLSDFDFDMGSLGPMFVPGTDLILSGDKFGNIYLADKKNLGHLDTMPAPSPRVLLASLYGGVFNTAIWKSESGTVFYIVDQGDALKAFKIVDGQLPTAPFSTTDVTADIPYQGMTVTANGSTAGTGILWMTTGDHDTDGVPGTLHAFDALDLKKELWNSNTKQERDQLGAFAKFVSPTVANGRVYVPTFSKQLVIYGLLPQTPAQ